MVHLLIQLYKSKFEERNAEMMEALNKNLACEHIHKITVFLDGDIEVPAHEKINVVPNTVRMTFSNYFEYINEVSQNEICCISNADIYFDDSLKCINDMEDDYFVALSRNDILNHPVSKDEMLRDCSQDSWFIKTNKPIPKQLIEDSDFYLGEVRCDNRIAFWCLVNGYKPINPCLLFTGQHIHKNFDTRTYDPDGDASINYLQMCKVIATNVMKYNPSKIASFCSVGGGGTYYGQMFEALAKQFFCKDKRVIE